MLLSMITRRFAALLVPFLFCVVACSRTSAQSGRDVEALRKEIEALKAQQAEMQRSLDEIRDFLQKATGGRFGAPSLVNTTFDVSGAPTNGRPSAPVTIIEISDYHCPFCRRHVQQTQPRLYSEYIDTGKARHVFIHYPIAQLHPDAYKSHEAAMCAADQGKFWDLHRKLFETPVKTPDELTGLAQSAGLDAKAFRSCLDSGKHAHAVQDSVNRIQKMNLSGTPMFLIGRTPAGSPSVKIEKVIEGAQSFETFKKVIDEVSAGK
jgi:protein-disulfide isomerase